MAAAAGSGRDRKTTQVHDGATVYRSFVQPSVAAPLQWTCRLSSCVACGVHVIVAASSPGSLLTVRTLSILWEEDRLAVRRVGKDGDAAAEAVPEP